MNVSYSIRRLLTCTLRSDASKSADGIISASLLGFKSSPNAAPAFWLVSITIDGGPDGDEYVFHGTNHEDVTFVAAEYVYLGHITL